MPTATPIRPTQNSAPPKPKKKKLERLGPKTLVGPQPGRHNLRWAWEKAFQFAQSTYIIARYGRPDLLLYYDGGIGDELLCTIVLRELRKRGQRNIWMRSAYPELFLYNEDVDRIVPNTFGLKLWTKLLRGKAIYPMYIIVIDGCDYYLPPPCHIITRMCQLMGITGEITLRPYLKLTDAEREKGRLVDRQIAIQSSGTTARFVHMNKQWYPERFQTVVDALKSEYNFVQVGAPGDPPLEGALDMRGKTSLRETAAILSQSMAFVGLVGFLMHLARAVECRSVIVYGGKELPNQSGYACNENLMTRLPCSPCWIESECDFDRECMRRITPEMVVEAIRRQTAKYGTPLPEETDTVPEQCAPMKADFSNLQCGEYKPRREA
jgi:hypothetical protein